MKMPRSSLTKNKASLAYNIFVNFINLANALASGSRRNFIVRMRCGDYEGDLDETDSHLLEIRNRCKEKRISYKDESYSVVHCTGYIRVKLSFFSISRILDFTLTSCCWIFPFSSVHTLSEDKLAYLQKTPYIYNVLC